ncbi:MAG: sigma-70 family RNA polymerase sigma factor [Chitinophagaceae bacterium]|nr:sigma-70 family RNA polymerase sigma factor [Chitinophagaceae bacterium]
MKCTNCQQLLTIETISVAFKNNQRDISEDIISCFYSCYQALFVQWAKIIYRHYPVDLIESLANDSFTDGVLELTKAAGKGELYQGNARVKTILFSYCSNILSGYLTKEKRLAEKNKKLALFLSDKAEHNTGDIENGINEKRHENIKLALAKMSAEDRQIIQWRHIERRSNDEIAGFLAITVASATNRIYRCMRRLRKLVEGMEKR